MPSILNIPDFDINRRKSSTNYCYGWSFQINLLGFAQKFKSGSHCCYEWSCLMHSLNMRFENVDVKDPFKWLCSIDSYLINWRSSSWLEKLSFVTSIHEHLERQPVRANEENRSAKLSECCPCPHTFTIYKFTNWSRSISNTSGQSVSQYPR